MMTANKLDKFKVDFSGTQKYIGLLQNAFDFVLKKQLLDPPLWRRFVEQFRLHSDTDSGWRGEFWGKMMRGACYVYQYSRNKELYDIICNTVKDMISSAEEGGKVTSYPPDAEFDAWDLWCRKYVLLGMQYFIEICEDDELTQATINSMCGQLEHIMRYIGDKKDGKKPITTATHHWRGLNASSLLDPVVRLYNITGRKDFFDFAEYIVNTGATDVVNIFDLAYKNELMPYQYPATKAYEMTSCFEGLLEFYRITGNKKYKTSIINFANSILENDFTVIGCAGCTHELFDHSTVRQANTNNNPIMQETCVTVTLMKFFWQVHLLTGVSKYADAFETSLYNAYLGSFNTEQAIEPSLKITRPDLHFVPVPFDSYSPLTAGTRGRRVGGMGIMPDKYYYGCCACIGALGVGMVPKIQLVRCNNNLIMNLYINGEITTITPNGNAITIFTETTYPKDGEIKITLKLQKPEEFGIKLRIPQWSKNPFIKTSGADFENEDGYYSLRKNWCDSDVIKLTLDMRTEAIKPIPYGQQILINEVVWGKNYVIPTLDREDPMAKYHIALRRGPVMLAQDSRLGYNLNDAIEPIVNKDGYVDVKLIENLSAPYENILTAEIPLKGGKSITLTDYASAGKLFSEDSLTAVWLLTK